MKKKKSKEKKLKPLVPFAFILATTYHILKQKHQYHSLKSHTRWYYMHPMHVSSLLYESEPYGKLRKFVRQLTFFF